MSKAEFLQGLKEALENDLDAYAVQENVRYYEQYISEEISKGAREEDVLNMLGDPWVIARNIIDSPGSSADGGFQGAYYETGYKPDEAGYRTEDERNSNIHVFRLDSWWKKVLLFLVILLIVMGIVALVTGLVSFFAPILVPMILVIFLVRLLGGRR